MEREVLLTRRKVEAGAQFFITQPTFHPNEPKQFLSLYADKYGEELSLPVFHGVQVMAQDGVIFSSVPKWVTDDLEKGRKGEDIALQVLNQFSDAGFRSIYLVPPIMRGGRRDYEAAQAVLDAFRE
jgi:5,10-methylenetetrahydrofolate reductase